MNKKDLLDSDALADVPDDEPLLVLRGSNPAVPEAVRNYAQNVLAIERRSGRSTDATRAEARKQADAAFALADEMQNYGSAHKQRIEDEIRAGLTANAENERLEKEWRERQERLAKEKQDRLELAKSIAELLRQDPGATGA